jgi:hypothetical protein
VISGAAQRVMIAIEHGCDVGGMIVTAAIVQAIHIIRLRETAWHFEEASLRDAETCGDIR